MSDTWLISVDDHVIEPPNVWTDRLPAKYRESGPRWISDEAGDSWLFEGRRTPIDSNSTAGSVWPVDDRAPAFTPLTFDEIPPACYDPKARVEAMNVHHELAAVCFPNMPGFAGRMFQQTDDKKLALLCIQAYNDWIIEEWVDAFPGRFIGLGLVPMWDGGLAAQEAERFLAKGGRSISFSQGPHNMGLPHIYDEHWAPLFTAMDNARRPLCTHLGTGMSAQEDSNNEDWAIKMREALKSNDLSTIAEKMGIAGPDASPMRRNMKPGTRTSIIGARMGQETLVDWLESGNFQRYPHLKLALSENGVGWIPSALSMADFTESLCRMETPTDDPLPSQVFREHVYGCFIHEPITPSLVELLGADNIMIETDFPHTATNWPNSLELALGCLTEISEADQWKILRGNAEKVFDFEPAEQPVLAH